MGSAARWPDVGRARPSSEPTHLKGLRRLELAPGSPAARQLGSSVAAQRQQGGVRSPRLAPAWPLPRAVGSSCQAAQIRQKTGASPLGTATVPSSCRCNHCRRRRRQLNLPSLVLASSSSSSSRLGLAWLGLAWSSLAWHALAWKAEAELELIRLLERRAMAARATAAANNNFNDDQAGGVALPAPRALLAAKDVRPSWQQPFTIGAR